jgi:hypothetical protein
MGLNEPHQQSQKNLPASGGFPSQSHCEQPWYEAYMAVLFEPHRDRIGDRIKSAEQLMLRRERELGDLTSASAEQKALNNALHALRALASCLRL